jgi:hypothetical protein
VRTNTTTPATANVVAGLPESCTPRASSTWTLISWKSLSSPAGRTLTGQLSTDPTVGVCFDADRLDLGRVGIEPDPELISTDAGRKRLLNTLVS